MRKLQYLLFLLKRSCTCYYLIFMTVPLRNTSHFEILNYREIELQIAVRPWNKEITVRNKGITICIFFTLISCSAFLQLERTNKLSTDRMAYSRNYQEYLQRLFYYGWLLWIPHMLCRLPLSRLLEQLTRMLFCISRDKRINSYFICREISIKGAFYHLS